MLYLMFILILAFILRMYGLNWDQGFHLHPDERMLIMVTERIHLFKQLNPEFFNYGSLPIYILRGLSQVLDTVLAPSISNYVGMLYVGRYLSLFFDLGTIFLIYKISYLLFKNYKIALLSVLFYAIAFFPIQNSHFFVVDVFLTFFTTLLTYLLLNFITIPIPRGRTKLVIFLAIVFAAMLSTKFTAVIFYPIIILVLYIPAMKQWNNRSILKKIFVFHLITIIFFFFFMPYAFLEFTRFFTDISAQVKMNSDPYIFPYTLQYVGTLPYLYYIKNIFWWGLGPFISIFSLVGLLNLLLTSRLTLFARRIKKLLFERSREQFNNIAINSQQLTIFFLFYVLYFLVIGRSAVKFMRYMLPVYPFLTITAGIGINSLLSFPGTKVTRNLMRFLALLGMMGGVFWSLMFINIYSQKHTRIAATEWILQNIPKDSTIALEHWDDGLPLTGGENYKHVELTLYDQPDDNAKWEKQNRTLNQADYIIIASNRLYIPLQKLTDCKKYKSCYPKTAEYYRKLFNGELEFKKVAEFSVYPKISINNYQLTINDDSADESFTVYDHPKIFIFKKI